MPNGGAAQKSVLWNPCWILEELIGRAGVRRLIFCLILLVIIAAVIFGSPVIGEAASLFSAAEEVCMCASACACALCFAFLPIVLSGLALIGFAAVCAFAIHVSRDSRAASTTSKPRRPHYDRGGILVLLL